MYPSLYLISAVSCEKGVGPRSAQTHTEIHTIQVHAEINLHKKYTHLWSPGVWSNVLSFGAPSPDPKRHFCNSMQASELCQKVLVSLKADLSFKVGASLMGSTFPSASFHVRFQYLHASMKPLNRFIRAKGKNNFTMRFSCRAFAASVKRRSIQDWTLQVHRQLMNSYFVGVQVSWCEAL